MPGRTTTPHKPQTLDHLLSQKKPVSKKVWIAGDSEVADQYQEQLQKVERLKLLANIPGSNGKESRAIELAAAEEELSRLEKKYRETALLFVFRSIGRKKFDEMVTANPPTEQDRKEAEAMGGDPNQLGWNPDGLAKILVPASSYDPTITEEDWESLQTDERFNSSEIASLFQGAINANTQRNVYLLGNG